MRLESRAGSDKRSLFERVVEFLSPGPDSRAELRALMARKSGVLFISVAVVASMRVP